MRVTRHRQHECLFYLFCPGWLHSSGCGSAAGTWKRGGTSHQLWDKREGAPPRPAHCSPQWWHPNSRSASAEWPQPWCAFQGEGSHEAIRESWGLWRSIEYGGGGTINSQQLPKSKMVATTTHQLPWCAYISTLEPPCISLPWKFQYMLSKCSGSEA